MRFLSNFGYKIIFVCISKIPTHCLKEALVTWPLSASGLFKKWCDFLPSQSLYAQTVKRVNQDSKKVHVTDIKCGKTHVNKSPLGLLLPLIGWKRGAIFCLANNNMCRQSYAPITTQEKHMTWAHLTNAGKCTWLNYFLQAFPREFVAKVGGRASQPNM